MEKPVKNPAFKLELSGWPAAVAIIVVSICMTFSFCAWVHFLGRNVNKFRQ